MVTVPSSSIDGVGSKEGILTSLQSLDGDDDDDDKKEDILSISPCSLGVSARVVVVVDRRRLETTADGWSFGSGRFGTDFFFERFISVVDRVLQLLSLFSSF